MKWYPSDWRGDPLVRACTPIARYVWFEMLGLMHEAEPYGFLVLNGRPLDAITLGRVIAVDGRTVAAALKELETLGVFSRTNEGVIICRRMIRENLRREAAVENGRKGGRRAALLGADHPEKLAISSGEVGEKLTLFGPDTPEQDQSLRPPTLKGLDNPHMPEARSQKPDKNERTKVRSANGGALAEVDSRGSTAKKQARGTRLSPDWTLSPAETEDAKRLGLTDADIRKAAPEFRDYWVGVPGTKGVKADWPATWRNRCRAIAERLGRTPPREVGEAKQDFKFSRDDWRRAIDYFEETSNWMGPGPQPGQAGCGAPPDLLEGRRLP